MEKWSEDDINKIIQLVKDGKTYSDISLIVGRTHKSIKTKFHRLNLKVENLRGLKKNEIKCCLKCGKQIIGDKKFCDHSCSALYNNDKRNVNKCLNCGKDIKNYLKYCNSECGFEFRYNEYIKNWKNGENNGTQNGNKLLGVSSFVRKYLHEKFNNKCAECGWDKINIHTGKIPLQIEHIDGNYMNNTEENLSLLCPSCHSLTATYGGSNKGSGRKNRSQLKYGGVST